VNRRTAGTLSCVVVAMLGSAASARPQDRGPLEQHIVVNGRKRSFLVDLPATLAATHSVPLVLNFHGGGGSPEEERAETGFSPVANAAGAIVVYPAGSAGIFGGRLLTWNTGACCGYAQRQNIDEAAFIRAMLDTLEREYPVDKNRVFATGFSNGGMMAYLVGCRLSDRVAAIGVVSGELSFPCVPQRPVSVLIIHGTADQNLPYNGGVGPKAIDRHDVRPVSSAVDAWRAIDRCPSPPVVTRSGKVTRRLSSGCAQNTDVDFYAIDGGGHRWPSGLRRSRVLDSPSQDLNATQVIWNFFVAHGRR
jgi:polyhydroxybutyrate depolymerase